MLGARKLGGASDETEAGIVDDHGGLEISRREFARKMIRDAGNRKVERDDIRLRLSACCDVVGERIELVTLVGPNGDAHVYSPTPADGRRLTEAKVVVANGLKFEGWIDRLIKSSGTKAARIEAAKGVKPLKGEEDGHGPGHHHDHGGSDPHAWQSVANVRIYVANIRDGLAKVDPAHADAYRSAAEAYTAELDRLDTAVRQAVEKIPPANRRIITTHDAFGYFADAYGLRFIAPQGVSTDSEASPRDVARIIRQIRQEKIPAVFLENISDPRLMQQIARESGAVIGGKVFSDALSRPDGPAPTYVAMMRHNLAAFTAALGQR